MVTDNTQHTVKKSLEKLYSWVLKHQYCGWDIYDGLNSPLTRNIKSPLIKALVLQGNKYSPINVRSVLGIEKGTDLKGMAIFAQAYALLHEVTGEDYYRFEMESAINFIKKKSLKEMQNYDCWASHYYPYIGIDGSTLSTTTPDIIGTSQSIIALIQSYKITKNPIEKEIASSAIAYVVDKLFVDDTEIPFFKYTGSHEIPLHVTLNASAQAMEAISIFLQLEDQNKLRSRCEKVSHTLLETQRADGSWVYSMYRNGSTKSVQLDFHQGYIIDGLLAYLPYSKNKERIHTCIARAAEYYQAVLFRHDGESYYRYPFPYPVDIHNQAQGIISFSKLSGLDSKYLDFAKQIALWTINNMQDSSGHFYYQKWPIVTNKIPHMRWGQAWMMLALAKLCKNLSQYSLAEGENSLTPSSRHDGARKRPCSGFGIYCDPSSCCSDLGAPRSELPFDSQALLGCAPKQRQKQKVKIFLCGPHAECGGVSNHTINLVNKLSSMGVVVRWHKFRGSHVAKMYNRTIGMLIQSIKQRNEYEIIHVQASAGVSSLSAALMGAVLSHLMKKRFIFTYHNSKILYPRLFKFCLWKADRVILVSRIQKDLIKKQYPEQIHKVALIPNGFDDTVFFPRNQSECKMKLGLSTNKKTILTVGNLLEVKGHRYLIEAMKTINNKRQDVNCVIVGTGRLNQKLRNQIILSGLESDIILTGRKPHDEVPLWINACDLFILPSLNEGNPTVMFETLGCGKPFVGTSVGGVPEIVTSDRYGLLVEPADPNGLAERILVALDRDWDREAILQYAERFTWENIAKEILSVYERT